MENKKLIEAMNLQSKALNLQKEVKEYIESFDKWYYYFTYDESFLFFLEDEGENEELFELEILNINNHWVDVCLTYQQFDDHYRVRTTIDLFDFEKKLNQYRGCTRKRVIESRIKECEEDLKYYEKCLAEEKEELEKLFNELKETEKNDVV